MPPGPGRRVPSTAEINPAVKIPWAIRSPNRLCRASSAFTCSGLKSPVTPAKAYTSASLMVLVRLAFCPGANSATADPSLQSVTRKFAAKPQDPSPGVRNPESRSPTVGAELEVGIRDSGHGTRPIDDRHLGSL